MVRAVVAFAVFAFAAEAVVMKSSNADSSKFTVNDIIEINGNKIAEGDGIDALLGCQTAPADATSITVCGCGVKVIANLLTECQPYKAYSEEVGTCDCSKSGCVTEALESGYTEKFPWKAASYEVVAC
eukprot:CAMPEP_0178433388 /NCGR_PEP_ID=MMETSP0689_2-20121128/32878_1 /TAXON_ID=160604 /ORGANISM="Amphidinium massartii, Strain CS-259" /LENGTH=127 /DNA_ID=CAMNT_0020055411 /DNA_START=101 /DNA_END=484 /DNA_ORIENTATION=-